MHELSAQIYITEVNNIQLQTSNFVQNKAIESRWDKTVLSVGIGDSRTGMSFVGFSYNILQKDKDEVFLGIGTAFFIYTASLGWKHYIFDDQLSPYTSVSLQAISSLVDFDEYWKASGISFSPTISAGIECEKSKSISYRLGINAHRVYSSTYGYGDFMYPSFNVDFRFF